MLLPFTLSAARESRLAAELERTKQAPDFKVPLRNDRLQLLLQLGDKQ
jgi:hypothetical protein